jgi:DNA-binding transcriptional LysR family regulator
MELAQARAFVSASRERNVARAAESLRLTPSPVSRAIKLLESEVGGEVLTRRHHDLELTELGAALLPHAVLIVAHVDEIARIASGRPSRLRIGATPWAVRRFPEQLEQLARASEDIVEVMSAPSPQLLHLMRHGELDMAIVSLPATFAGISSRPLARYQLRVYAEPGHPIAGKEVVTLSELVGSAVVTLPLSLSATPVILAAANERLRQVGLGEIVELSLEDWLVLPQVLRKTGQVLIGNRSAENAISTVLESDGLVSVLLAEDDFRIIIGVAWSETTANERVRDLAQKLDPLPSEPIDIID